MGVQPKLRMTVDEFLVWAEDRPGRYELVDGEIVAMSPEQVGHARVKFRVQTALQRAIDRSGLSCEMLPDGITVRVGDKTAFEPDALVQCGPRAADETLTATDPVLVVEVLSPSTKHVDTGKKLAGYFSVPSIVHYLIVDPAAPIVIHHRRGDGGIIETRILATGTLDLDPPGIVLAIEELLARS